MRGHKYFNFPAFDHAQAKLEALGFEVINPAEMDRQAGCNPLAFDVPEDFDWMSVPAGATNTGGSIRDVFLRDTRVICSHADILYCLKGWETSAGAVAEVALGRALRLMVMEDLFP
jgi:hypothetical protein